MSLKLEIVDLRGSNILEDFKKIENGFIFHFFCGESSLFENEGEEFKLNIKDNWKIILPGTKNSLEILLEKFKDLLEKEKNNLIEDIDQFGYLFIILIKNEDNYELIISSDSVDLFKIALILNKL